ncbi:hypothetical protein [Frankia sp. AiPa1]|uniref:hypothetical protein n=1 Tax=Frankia sp. AiPa1 TaxID=573492 RepID=UPI00202B3E66|nr:hypothetical protein [Frankia sp. AiPa1]MCL9760022.1 hypothetical protein [Frankia sp. AiPa1]
MRLDMERGEESVGTGGAGSAAVRARTPGWQPAWAPARPAQWADLAGRLGIAALLAASGYIHLDLYRTGYRVIPKVGTMFLLQESGSFAVAFLLLLSGSLMLRLAAAGLAGGALVGFVLSRTVGVFGFAEHGLNPAPDALESILTEAGVLVLVAATLLLFLLRSRRQTTV